MRGAWPALPLTSGIACAAVMFLATLDRRVIGVVLALTYVAPALIYLRVGHYHPQYIDAWMALLLASILPDSFGTSWHLPRRWRTPLIGWGLVTIAGATIVGVREVDFTPALFSVTTVANTAGGGWPAFIIRWVLHVALVTTIGILWFDWLLGARNMDFHRVVALPLGVSALTLSLVALYQLFVDVTFLNPTVYASLTRASATVLDANVAGTLAALWLGGFVLVALAHPSTVRFTLPMTMMIGWLAVWATGSRTAFAAAAIVTGFNVVTLANTLAISRRRMRMAIAGAVLTFAALVIVLARADLGVVGPAARFRASISGAPAGSIQGVLYEQLWNRNGYGGAATAMIARFPWFGVGVGSFQSLLPEFAAFSGGPIPPDNAQNWYRHQLAELGVIGSLPWIAWFVLLGWYVLRRRPGLAPHTWTIRGMLVAMAAISFVGMPGQEPIVAITFWTMTFWFMRVAGIEEPRPISRSSLAAVGALLAIFAAGCLYAAVTELRVPIRAQRGGWTYSYGFYRPGAAALGAGPGWTGRRAVAVFETPAEWLALTVSADHRAVPGSTLAGATARAPSRPTAVTVWCNGTVVVDAELRTTAPLTTYVRVPPTGSWVRLESWVNRLVPLRQLGVDDSRQVGVFVDWAPAPGPSSQQEPVACGAN